MRIILSILLSFVITSNLIAQITIREETTIEKPIQPIQKPQVYDSLTNFVTQSRPIDYKKYIGQQLFYPPRSNKDKDFINREVTSLFSDTVNYIKTGKIPFEETYIYKSLYVGKKMKKSDINYPRYIKEKEFAENADKGRTNIYLPLFRHIETDKLFGGIKGIVYTDESRLEGRYFTILDIKARAKNSKESLTENSKNNFKKLEDINDEKYLELNIFLRNEETKDSLNWIIEDQRHISRLFYIVGYFEKQQKLYIGKNFIATEGLEKILDTKTGEIFNINPGDKLECYDVAFRHSTEYSYVIPSYYLRIGNREFNMGLGYFDENERFMDEEKYVKQEKIKKLIKEEQEQEEREKERIEQEAERKYKNGIIAKYGSKKGNLILEGKVILGMNKQMCLAAWGEPDDINKTIARGITHEQWVYGFGSYLYFENGILVTIQE